MDRPFQFKNDAEGDIAKLAADYTPAKNITKAERRALQKIFGSGKEQQKNIKKLQRSFSRAKAIENDPKDIGIARPHELTGNLNGYWAFTIRGPWRACFKWGPDHGYQKGIFDIHITDYH